LRKTTKITKPRKKYHHNNADQIAQTSQNRQQKRKNGFFLPFSLSFSSILLRF